MLAKEIERIGIPVAHITALTPIAQVVGSNRIVTGVKIISPLGDPTLSEEMEILLRRRIVEKALNVLENDVIGPTIF